MAAQKGRDLLLKLNTTGSTYVAIGGMREVTYTINNEPVDITNADDAGMRRYLAAAGVGSMSIKAQSVYVDSTYEAMIQAAALTKDHKRFQLVVPGQTPKTFEGEFMIQSFEGASAYNGTITLNFTLESSGAITIT